MNCCVVVNNCNGLKALFYDLCYDFVAAIHCVGASNVSQSSVEIIAQHAVLLMPLKALFCDALP